MTRVTLERPPIEQMVDENGMLNEEWSTRLDETFLYLAEKQKEEEALLNSETGVSEAVQNYVDARVAEQIEALGSDAPIITTYSEDFVLSPNAFITFTHNLDTTNPLWNVVMETTVDRTFWLYGTTANTAILRWNSVSVTNATVTFYKIVIPT